MIDKEYSTCCGIALRVKHDIKYDRWQVANLVCANFIHDILCQQDKYFLTTREEDELLNLIERLLGHRINFLGYRNVEPVNCYYGVVNHDFEITADNIKNLRVSKQKTKLFLTTVTTNDQKVVYAYPTRFRDLTSIKSPNSRQFQLLKSFTKHVVDIDGIPYNVYILTRSSSVDEYGIIFV